MTFYFSPFTIVNQYRPFFSLNPSNMFSFEPFYQNKNELTTQTIQEKSPQPNFELENQVNSLQNQPIVKKIAKKPSKIEDKNFGFRDQDKQRNILSNILKTFLSVLLQKRQLDNMVQKSLKLVEQNLNVEQFYANAKALFEDVKSYLSPKTLKQKLFCMEQDDSYKKVLRMVLSHYLRLQFNISLLRSGRVKKKSKLLQMKKARYLRSLIQ